VLVQAVLAAARGPDEGVCVCVCVCVCVWRSRLDMQVWCNLAAWQCLALSSCTIVQFLQGLVACICIMFGVLWFRAVERVRSNVAERAPVSRRIASLLAVLPPDTKIMVMSRVVQLQASARRRLALRLRQRLLAIDAYVVGRPRATALESLLHSAPRFALTSTQRVHCDTYLSGMRRRAPLETMSCGS
jgi:hypothetical protein